MDTLTLIKSVLDKDNSVADSLLAALDEHARNYGNYEYGLPMYEIDGLRLVVIRWLLSLEDKAKGVA